MPEGHTIHRLARDLNRDLRGQFVAVTSPQGRFVDGAAAIDGQALKQATANGKHLFMAFGDGDTTEQVIHIHLGLFGKFRRARTSSNDPRDTLRLRLASTDWTWDLSGPTACELVDEYQVDAIHRRLGPDPLRGDSDGETFVRRAGKSSRSIGLILMDQAVIAGVGNVYRSEICFRAGIDPRTAANSLTADQLRALWGDAVELLQLGVRLGRIVTVDPSENDLVGPKATAATLKADKRVYVYRRETCLRCGAPVSKFDMGNRNAYACTAEQRRA